MYHIAICDDEEHCSQQLERLVQEYFSRQKSPCSITIYSSAEELLSDSISGFDIIFLDVVMEQQNGISAAHEIRKLNNRTIIIFVSALVEYSPLGYEVSAFRYLLKSTLEQSFFPCMDAVMCKLENAKRQYSIKLPDGSYTSIPLKNILYFEAQGRYVVVYLSKLDRNQLTFCGRLSDIEQVLSSYGFLRIQRSYLVNMRFVQKIRNYQAFLSNGSVLSTSEKDYRQLLQTFTLWKGRNS